MRKGSNFRRCECCAFPGWAGPPQVPLNCRMHVNLNLWSTLAVILGAETMKQGWLTIFQGIPIE